MTAAAQPPERSHRDNTLLYALIAAGLVVLLIVAILTFGYQRSSQQAEAKAAQLEERWDALGLAVPENRDVLVRLFGNDGGAICDTTDDDLAQGLLRLAFANGAAGPGQRAVTVDEQVIQGERAVVEVYCPEQLDEFDDFVDELDFDDVIRGL